MAMSQFDHSTALDHAPDSPPELSSSRSSKSSSSSFRSTCIPEGVDPENLSHFEEITLAEAKKSIEIAPTDKIRRTVITRPAPRPMPLSSASSRKRGAQTMDTLSSVQMARPRYPSAGGRQVSGGVLQDVSPNYANRRMMVNANGHAQPSSAGGLMTMKGRHSRSPSPSKSMLGDAYGSSTHSLSSSPSHSHKHFPGYARRQSWQPGRKTVKELEAEYHDSDEEVPDDAVIWNVPISPHPGAVRSSRSPSPKKQPSRGDLKNHSPQRNRASLGTPSPPSAGRQSLPRSATVGAFPTNALSLHPVRERTKSWTNDLSDDARHITLALEMHATRLSSEDRQSTSSAPTSPPRPTMKLRSRTSAFELPPVQRGNIMIDPLPISKEKEAVLARTRPSWLPPKCRKEEQRHLKEWEKMMARAADSERRRATKQLEDVESRREDHSSIAKIWEEHVLPDWATVIDEPRTRELWWRGVTPKSRGKVWAKAIGNDLELSAASYAAACKRSGTSREEIRNMSVEQRASSKEAAWHSAIERDVPTVYSKLGLFAQGAPLHDALTEVLMAYVAYRSDVGYCFGTHLVAGLLVLNMAPQEAFIALANLLNRPLPLAYLVRDGSAIDRSQDLILSTLKYKIPALHDHLARQFENQTEWLEPMLSTLMTRHLDVDAVSRVWDVYVFEGDKLMVRAVVGLLGRLESKLYGSREEILALLGWEAKAWSDIGSEDEIIRAIRDAGKVDKR